MFIGFFFAKIIVDNTEKLNRKKSIFVHINHNLKMLFTTENNTSKNARQRASNKIRNILQMFASNVYATKNCQRYFFHFMNFKVTSLQQRIIK